MTSSIKIETVEDARTYVRRACVEAGRDLVIPAICEKFNCREADVDDDGRIWISSPQRGHWVSDENIIDFANWDAAR